MEDSSLASETAGSGKLNKGCCSSSSFRLRSPSLNSLRLRRIFDLFDKNGDGMITVEDLSQALSLLGLEADISELESTIQAHIKEGNKGLEFEDFASLHHSLDDALFGGGGSQMQMQQQQQQQLQFHEEDSSVDPVEQEESDLSEAFKVFDTDGDGYISAHELQVVLQKLGLPEATEMDRVEQMIVSVDRNQDGRVDFSEFKQMMRSSLLLPSSTSN